MRPIWRIGSIACLLLLRSCSPCLAQVGNSNVEHVHIEAGRAPVAKSVKSVPMSPIQKADAGERIQLVRLTSTDIPEPVKQACYSVARVTLDQGRSAQMGSATYLGNGLWLTNRHVVEGGAGRYSVKLKTGETLDAKVNSISQGNADLAVVETIDLDSQISPVIISNDEPRPGMVVYPSGFDHGRLDQHICWPAQIVNIFADGDIESKGLSARKGSISGNSGGPTFTSDGQLLAPLFANGGSDGNCTSTGTGTCITVNSFACRTYLLPWRERIMRSLTGRGGCYGGSCPPQGMQMQPRQYQGPIQPPQYLIPASPQAQFQPQFQQQPQINNIPSYQPQPQLPPQPAPATVVPAAPVAPQVTAGPVGPKGDQGPQGASGPKGDPGEITQQHLAIVAAEVRKSLAADPGIRGPQGPAGPAGAAATIDTEAIVAEVLRRLPETRVMLVDGQTKKVIDDERYKPGEAIVFDINKLLRSTSSK